MNIQNIDPYKLIPYKNNPRNNDDAVPYVKSSIERFGFKVPMVIDTENVVICGHTRLKAALELGLSEVPCVIADDLTEDEIKAFRLADNMVAEQASWDAATVQGKEKALEVAMRTMLGIGPKVHLVQPKTITRSEGKAVRVIDRRKLHD